MVWTRVAEGTDCHTGSTACETVGVRAVVVVWIETVAAAGVWDEGVAVAEG